MRKEYDDFSLKHREMAGKRFFMSQKQFELNGIKNIPNIRCWL